MKYCLLFLTILFSSCNSEPDYNDYLSQMGIVLNDQFKVLGNNSESAIGDFVLVFKLKISDKDYENIIAKIKQTENYSEYKNGEYPKSFGCYGRDYNFFGYKQGDAYFLKKEHPLKPIFYEIVIEVDKTLHFTYAED